MHSMGDVSPWIIRLLLIDSNWWHDYFRAAILNFRTAWYGGLWRIHMSLVIIVDFSRFFCRTHETCFSSVLVTGTSVCCPTSSPLSVFNSHFSIAVRQLPSHVVSSPVHQQPKPTQLPAFFCPLFLTSSTPLTSILTLNSKLCWYFIEINAYYVFCIEKFIRNQSSFIVFIQTNF